jgi:hypothetical protein
MGSSEVSQLSKALFGTGTSSFMKSPNKPGFWWTFFLDSETPVVVLVNYPVRISHEGGASNFIVNLPGNEYDYAVNNFEPRWQYIEPPSADN